MAAQILGLGSFDSTNSAQIIKPSPGICAVMCGAGVTDVDARASQGSGLHQERLRKVRLGWRKMGYVKITLVFVRLSSTLVGKEVRLGKVRSGLSYMTGEGRGSF